MSDHINCELVDGRRVEKWASFAIPWLVFLIASSLPATPPQHEPAKASEATDDRNIGESPDIVSEEARRISSGCQSDAQDNPNRVTEETSLPNDILTSWLDRKLIPADEARQMVPQFVEQQLRPISLPETLDDWKKRREQLRQDVLRIVGLDDLLPARWDLHLVHHGTIERDEYRIKKITYETYPGFTIGAVLYLPTNVDGRVPGIVSISGHTPDSKAAAYVQQRNINLVLRGCVVLSYDYFGYGDRKTGDQPYPTGANGHQHRHFSYSRRCATTLEILDAVRAIDVLCRLPEVDPDRVGFTGESGGGNSTYWIAAVDPRVKLAIPVSSVTTFNYWIRGDINWDWHQRPPGIRGVADIGTLLALHAPHPLVVISSRRGTDDAEFPLQEAENSFQWAKRVYQLYDADELVHHYESRTGHGYQEDKREEMYRAVERWLNPPRSYDGQELPVIIEATEELRCKLPANNKTFAGIFTDWIVPLPNIDLTESARREFLRQRLGWPDSLPTAQPHVVDRVTHGAWEAEFWRVRTEPGIHVPVIVIGPKDQPKRPITLIPDREPDAIRRGLRNGQRVVAFDVRGIGETRTGQGGVWSSLAGPPWSTLLTESGDSWCNWSWFAGRPVAGQWALDMAQVARFARDQYSMESVGIDGENDFGWPALLAGAMSPEIISSGRVRLHRESLREDLQGRGEQALADVPGLLERLDIRSIRDMWPGEFVIDR